MRFLPRRCWPRVLAALLLTAAAGCYGNDSSTKPGTETKTAPQEVKVTPITSAGYLDTIQQLKGKVILVDFWFNN